MCYVVFGISFSRICVTAPRCRSRALPIRLWNCITHLRSPLQLKNIPSLFSVIFKEALSNWSVASTEQASLPRRCINMNFWPGCYEYAALPMITILFCQLSSFHIDSFKWAQCCAVFSYWCPQWVCRLPRFELAPRLPRVNCNVWRTHGASVAQCHREAPRVSYTIILDMSLSAPMRAVHNGPNNPRPRNGQLSAPHREIVIWTPLAVSVPQCRLISIIIRRHVALKLRRQFPHVQLLRWR